MADPPLVWEIPGDGGDAVARPMTPDEIAQAEANEASHQQQQLGAQQAFAADAERLAVINERAATDPAYAALADMVLGRQGV